MGRNKKYRCCRAYFGSTLFKPIGIPMSDLDVINLNIDELEAMRLCDLENLDQTEAGYKMKVSRGTIQRLIKSARAKFVQAIIEKKALKLTKLEDSNESMSTDYG